MFQHIFLLTLSITDGQILETELFYRGIRLLLMLAYLSRVGSAAQLKTM